jgi:serine phosphatase RsbU (regulator of sigma subunit)
VVAAPLGVLLGAAIVGARRRYDLLEVVRGAPALRLESAIQWSVLAPTIHEEPGLEVAARVEPADEHAGDAWDFSVRDGQLTFALFDAMGHGLQAALTTTLVVSAYRWSRRRGDDLVTTARTLDEAVATAEPRDQFVTANLCQLEIATGQLTWLCAGHPAPLLVRGDVVQDVGREAPLRPLGLGGERRFQQHALASGEAVLLYSDGVIEARRAGGPAWGLPSLCERATREVGADAPLMVGIRSLLDAVVDHAGEELRDDATLFAVRWHRPQ